MKKFLICILAALPLISMAHKGYVRSLPLKFYLTYSDGSQRQYETWWTNNSKTNNSAEEDAAWIKERIEESRTKIYQIAPTSTKIDSVQYNINTIEVTYDAEDTFDANSLLRLSGTYILNEQGEFVLKQ